MAKKNKKQTRKTPAAAVVTPSAASSVTSSAFAPTLTASRTSDSDFKPDYSATKKDLKRIGILASSFFIILVILSFFLR